MNNKYKSGFTLVELLVAIAIFGLLFVIIISITTSMSESSQNINSRSLLTQEGQNIQRLLAGRISEAVYIYPAGTSLNLGSGDTTRNTISGGNSWTVNRDPFIAMILPPRSPGGDCTTGGDQTGCYRFYAYYAMHRKVLANSSLADSTKPPKDPINDDSWVLMQYNANLVGWTPSYTQPSDGVTNPPSVPANSNGRGILLVDYVQPQTNDNGANDLFPKTGTAPKDCLVFCVVKTPTKDPAKTPQKANDGIVEVRFRMQQKLRGQNDIIVNGTDPINPTSGNNSYIGGVTSPRNWWMP